MFYLGVDLGGTNIAVGVVDEAYQIQGSYTVKTNAPRAASEIAADIALCAEEAIHRASVSQGELAWVGIGSPGTVDPASGEVEFANNLGFFHQPLQRMVAQKLQLPTYLENDANAAAYGEMLAGAAVGKRHVVAVTLGTGVGCGLLIDGRIYSGSRFAGGELGHCGMVYNGLPCSCGRRGCAEMYCSATALIRQTQSAMKREPASLMWKVSPSLQAVTGRTAFDAMRLGDSAAKEVVTQYLDYLGYLLTDLANLLEPEVILIGGGLSKEGDTLLDPLNQYVQSHTCIKNPAKIPLVLAASLGNDAGIIGAAFLGRLASYTKP